MPYADSLSKARLGLFASFVLLALALAVSFIQNGASAAPSAATPVASPTSTCQPGWGVVASPDVGIGSNLNAMAAVTANNIWAVGYATVPNPFAHFVTLVEHWNGISWQVIPSPNTGTGDNQLYAISARSADDIWAVGSYGSGSGFG